MEIDKVFSNDVDGVADNLFSAVKNSVSEIKAMQQRKAAENVQLVIQALKKIESDLQDKYDGVTTVIEKRVSTIKDGRDGLDGRNGRDGKDGRPGRDGAPGARGAMGVPGTNGRDGEDGVSVTDAKIDFDGSLVISLSSGREINVGEVVAPDLAEKIKVITNGGGTSQSVLDSLASLQAQITALSNLGAVNYVGTWNASTNNPTITSGSGDKGDYYVVSVAGSTSIDGQTLWGVGDWIIFNGVVWQRVDGGSTGDFTTVNASGNITTGGDIFTNPNFGIFFSGPSSFSTGIFSSSDGSQMRFYAGGTVDALRLTGTGFGVFNNSPAAALDVTGTARVSGTVTLSGGTANGVAYLNGSKVLTTGSALTFDGTNLGLNCTATNFGANYRTIEAKSASTTTSGVFRASSSDASQKIDLFIDAGVGTLRTDSNHPLAFSLNNSEQMRLTSTGLGIGITNPANKLVVSNAGAAGFEFDPANGVMQTYNRSGGAYTATNLLALQINFKTGSSPTTNMVLDSSGNLGIGTSSPSYKLDVYGTGSQTIAVRAATSGDARFYAECAGTNSGWMQYTRSLQALQFSANGSTQHLTLDSSGNLGLGVTPSAWDSSSKALQLTSGSLWSFSTSQINLLQNAFYNASGNFIYANTAAASAYRQISGVHSWHTAASGTAGNAITFTQAMTLDADGDLGIGVTSPSYKLDVNRASGTALARFTGPEYAQVVHTDGIRSLFTQVFDNEARLFTESSTPLVFGTANTERARIDSSGNLLVGTTAIPAINVKGNALQNFSNQGRLAIGATISNADLAYFYSSTALAGAINVNGSVCTYTSFSDYRLKEDVAPMTGALAKVAALKPVTYKWKTDGSAGQGFIAHELQTIVPECVIGEKDSVDEEGNPKYQGIDTSFLVATLTAAIQELKAEFDAYKATHP